MRRFLAIISWILVVFYVFAGLAYGVSMAGILFFLLAVLTLPIKIFDDVWITLGKNRIIKYCVLIILFGIALSVVPTDATNSIDIEKAIDDLDNSDTPEPNNKANNQQNKVEAEGPSFNNKVNDEESIAENADIGKDIQDVRGVIITRSQNDGKKTVLNNNTQTQTTSIAEKEELVVHFLNVGQGDATIVKCGNEAMIIDAGPDSAGIRVQKYLTDLGIKELKYVIVTHPDADHIGGMDVVIYKFNCEKVFMTNHEKDTKAYRALVDAMDSKSYKRTLPIVGEVFQLGAASFQIISPALDYSEENNNSIVIRLDHGNNHFLFAGDAEVQAQQEMSYGGYSIQANVMKIPHHGGKSGLQEWFLKEVNPEYAIISCGNNNDYGHPHEQVMNILKTNGTKVFRTDEQGNIIAKSDGEKITFNQKPTTSWKSGYVEPYVEETAAEDFIASSDFNSVDEQIVSDRSIPIQESSFDDGELISGQYVVNGKNGKIHIRGKCSATNPTSSSHMKQPIACDTYEQAVAESKKIDPSMSEAKRKCGNCY